MKSIYYSLLICYLIFVGCKQETSSRSTITNIKKLDYKDSISSYEIEKNDFNQKETVDLKKDSKPTKNLSNTTLEKNNNFQTDSSKYYIYFTLDDGPQPGTRTCRNILKENNIRATFFMVGAHNESKERKELVDSINNDPLFIISNHSDTHAHNKYSQFYSNPKTSFQDFITAENKLGIKHKIARLPGRNTWAIENKIKGESSAFAVAKKLDSAGYSVFGWDIEWRFIHGNVPVESASLMAKNVETRLKSSKTFTPKTIVILVHDRMFENQQHADSLKKFITILKQNNNYIFDTLDNYPLISIDNKTMVKK